ncbi:hypothetical protein EF62_0843 [Enterococcus faecalis 62]|nr:hypothetical protein EF62_0843 [Enterococcus faecalis 62]
MGKFSSISSLYSSIYSSAKIGSPQAISPKTGIYLYFLTGIKFLGISPYRGSIVDFNMPK